MPEKGRKMPEPVGLAGWSNGLAPGLSMGAGDGA